MDNNQAPSSAPTPSQEPTSTPGSNPTPVTSPTPNIPINNGPATTNPFATPTINTSTQGKKLPGKLVGIIAGVIVLAIIAVVVLLLTSSSRSQSTETNPDSNPDNNSETKPDSDRDADDTKPDLDSAVDIERSDDYSALSTAISSQRPEVGTINVEDYIGDRVDPSSGAPYVTRVVEYDPEWLVRPSMNRYGTEIFIVLNATCYQNTPVASSAADAYVIYGAVEGGDGTYCISGS